MTSYKQIPLISIIIPVYNVEKYLKACINSVRQQSYSNLEIILINDGSPDKCPQICDDLAELDQRIRVIHQPNRGVSEARNIGLSEAKGEYISFVDSDDLLHAQYTEVLYKLIEKTGLNYSMCRFAQFIDGQNPEYDLSDGDSYSVVTGETLLKAFFINDQYQQASACKRLYRRDFLLNNSLRFPVGCRYEDAIFSVRMLYLNNQAAFTNASLYGYRQNHGSSFETMSVYDREKSLIEMEKQFMNLSLANDRKHIDDIRFYMSFLNIHSLKILSDTEINIREKKQLVFRARQRASTHRKVYLTNPRLSLINKASFLFHLYSEVKLFTFVWKSYKAMTSLSDLIKGSLSFI